MNNKKKIIRAKDYLPVPAERTEAEKNADLESFSIAEHPKYAMIDAIFGGLPDYTKLDKIDDIKDKLFDTDDEKIIAYCLKKGIDILDDDGDIVEGYIDIAAMLKAIDKKLFKPGKESAYEKS